MEELYCNAFPGAYKFRMPVGSNPLVRNRGFRDHDALRIHAEIVVADDNAGKAVHQDSIAVSGNEVKNNAPTLALPIIRPIIVRDYDSAVLGVAAGGNEGAAVAGAGKLRRAQPVLLLIKPGNVIAGYFQRGVQRDDVVEISFHALGVHAIDDALKFLAIFLFNFGPQNVARGFAEEIPVASGLVGNVDPICIQHVFDVMREPVAMLEADLQRRAFGVNVNPAAAIER